MRISDWSSDVSLPISVPLDCFAAREYDREAIGLGRDRYIAFAPNRYLVVAEGKGSELLEFGTEVMVAIVGEIPFDAARLEYLGVWRKECLDAGRSEERRVGKECESPCRSRWAPIH